MSYFFNEEIRKGEKVLARIQYNITVVEREGKQYLRVEQVTEVPMSRKFEESLLSAMKYHAMASLYAYYRVREQLSEKAPDVVRSCLEIKLPVLSYQRETTKCNKANRFPLI